MSGTGGTRGAHGFVKPRPAGTLKDAILALVERLGGAIRAGEIAEVTKGQVQRWTDPDSDNAAVFPSAGKVRLLEAAAGEPVVTRFLAAEAGFVLVPASGEMGPALPVLAALAAGEFGDVLRAIADGTAGDGALSPAEAGRVIKEIDEALAALAAARAFAAAARDGADGGRP